MWLWGRSQVLNDVCTISVDEKVTETMKVKSVDPPLDVQNKDGKSLKKQDCVVGDCDGVGRVVLWEDDVGNMKGDCYELEGVMVKPYWGVNYSPVGKDSRVVNVGEIGEAVEIKVEKGIVRKVVEGEVDGVVY